MQNYHRVVNMCPAWLIIRGTTQNHSISSHLSEWLVSENGRRQALVGMWGKGGPGACSLLMGMLSWVQLQGKTACTILKTSKLKLPKDPVIRPLGVYVNQVKTLVLKWYLPSMFIGLYYLPLPRYRNNPSVIHGWMDKRVFTHTHTLTGILFSHKEEENPIICDNVGGP